MKKIAFYLTLLSLIMIFAGCQQPTNDNSSDEGNTNTYSPAQIAELKAIYAELIGTTWENSNNERNDHYIETAAFASDSVTFNNVQYSLNQNTDLFFENEVTDEAVKGWSSVGYNSVLKKDKGFYIKINNVFYAIDGWVDKNTPYRDKTPLNIKCGNNRDSLELTSSSGDSEDTSSVNGSYAFNSATKSQVNGTITLSDGNFTYSGGKNQAPSSGTYTVNGSDITFKWTAMGYETSTTVNMSKDGSSVTFSSKEVLFFSTFFGSTEQSGGKYTLTFTYSE